MRAAWTRTTEPAIEPITLAEAKLHARITSTADDAALASYIGVARQAAEDVLNRGLLTQTWKLTLSSFADRIWLPMAAPLQSVSSVKYYDSDGTLQTLASTYYDTDTVSRPAALVRAANQSWPSLQSDRRTGRVEITYVVGWTAASLVPQRIRQGIRMYVAYLDADRDGLAEQASAARAAAEACWADRIEWQAPECVDVWAT